jgi:RNA polymerase sigma factor (sigma-70 family)
MAARQYGDDSDAELLARLADRSSRGAAWSVLVERHSPRMYAVARSFSLDAQTSEDLVQTAWLRLLERVEQLRDHAAVGPWLCMVVRNEARKLVTRRRVTPSDEMDALVPADDRPLDGAVIADERARALRAAFARLGGDCQQLLRLLCADPPLSYDELAVVLDRPRGAIGPTRQRCIEQLRRHLPAGHRP